ERSLGDYQRTSRKEDQNRLAVLDRVGQKQIEPSLSERFCWQLEIRENLVSRLLNTALAMLFGIIPASACNYAYVKVNSCTVPGAVATVSVTRTSLPIPVPCAPG